MTSVSQDTTVAVSKLAQTLALQRTLNRTEHYQKQAKEEERKHEVYLIFLCVLKAEGKPLFIGCVRAISKLIKNMALLPK